MIFSTVYGLDDPDNAPLSFSAYRDAQPAHRRGRLWLPALLVLHTFLIISKILLTLHPDPACVQISVTEGGDLSLPAGQNAGQYVHLTMKLLSQYHTDHALVA